MCDNNCNDCCCNQEMPSWVFKFIWLLVAWFICKQIEGWLVEQGMSEVAASWVINALVIFSLVAAAISFFKGAVDDIEEEERAKKAAQAAAQEAEHQRMLKQARLNAIELKRALGKQ